MGGEEAAGAGRFEPAAVYLAAGGRSSRFGSDKARAVVKGRALVVHAAGLLSGGDLSRVTVVAEREGKYADLGLRTIADDEPGKGPVAGLARALRDAGTEWIWFGSCDLVRFDVAWQEAMLAARGAELDAVALRGEGMWEPLPGLYRKTAVKAATERLAAGKLSMQGLLDELRTGAVALPGNWPGRVSANSREELERLAGEWGL